MKVTRPPGRDPAGNAVSKTSPKGDKGQRRQWAESRLLHASAFHTSWVAQSAVEQLR
jgi:hypothetical protein